MLWVLFAVNTVALLVWEFVVAKGEQRRGARWVTRLLASVSGGFITTLAVMSVLAAESAPSLFGALAWVIWMACAYYWYRYIELDVYVLAIGVLSVVTVVSASLGRLFFSGDVETFLSLLIMSIVVIGLSACGAYWLRGVVAGDKS